MAEITTLRSLRIDHHLGYKDIAEGVGSRLNRRMPQSTIAMWESRGVQKAEILKALADFYQVDFDVIMAAARNSQRKLGPPTKRGPRKNITNCTISP